MIDHGWPGCPSSPGSLELAAMTRCSEWGHPALSVAQGLNLGPLDSLGQVNLPAGAILCSAGSLASGALMPGALHYQRFWWPKMPPGTAKCLPGMIALPSRSKEYGEWAWVSAQWVEQACGPP